MRAARITIREDGPLGRHYPEVELVNGADRYIVHRRYGSWMIDTDTGRREPIIAGMHVAGELQALPDVRAFDRARKQARNAAVASPLADPAPAFDPTATQRRAV